MMLNDDKEHSMIRQWRSGSGPADISKELWKAAKDAKTSELANSSGGLA